MKKEQWQIDFYKSTAWRRIRKLALNRDMGMCRRCKKLPADMVHHVKPLRDYPELGLELDNLMSLCNTCHEQVERRKAEGKVDKWVAGVRIIRM
jgi:Restriction endonuclease